MTRVRLVKDSDVVLNRHLVFKHRNGHVELGHVGGKDDLKLFDDSRHDLGVVLGKTDTNHGVVLAVRGFHDIERGAKEEELDEEVDDGDAKDQARGLGVPLPHLVLDFDSARILVEVTNALGSR